MEADGAVEVPICKHWRRMGWCLYADKCRYRHPPIATGDSEEDQKTEGTSSLAEERRSAFSKLCNERFRNRGPGRRNRIRNRSKAGAFRRWLHDTFGRELLGTGTGVLDVAGGKGELSFELANLSGIPTTVVDPRSLQLDRFLKRLPLGIYHRNGPWQCYNFVPAPASIAEARVPGHLRTFFDDELLQLLARDQQGDEEGAAKGFRAKVEAARSVAWTDKGLVAAGKKKPLAGTYGPNKPNKEKRRSENEDGDPTCCDVDCGHDDDGEGDESEVVGHDDSKEKFSQREEERQTEEQQEEEPIMEWPAVRKLLLGCSLILGLHPDQATEAIVDFAIKWNKGFAIVPCCVYQKQFQRRKHNGEHVTTYNQFVAYLLAKAPDRIKTATLDFEGKNLVLYAFPPSDPSTAAAEETTTRSSS